MLRPSFCATIVVGLSVVVVGGVRAADPAPSARWEASRSARLRRPTKSSRAAGGARCCLSRLKSSIRFWKSLAKDFPKYNVINRGFGGSAIADSTYYADRIVILYRPSAIILHAGSNDLSGGKTPRQVYDDFRAFVDRVHSVLPDTPIAFLSINPTPLRWAQADKQKETNGLIQRYIEGKKGLAFIKSMGLKRATRPRRTSRGPICLA